MRGALLEEQSKDGETVEELGGSGYSESPRSHLDTWTGEVLPHWVQFRTWTVGSSGPPQSMQRPVKAFFRPCSASTGMGEAVVTSLSPRLEVWILEGSHELLWGRSQGDFMEAVSHQDNQVTSGQLVWGSRS